MLIDRPEARTLAGYFDLVERGRDAFIKMLRGLPLTDDERALVVDYIQEMRGMITEAEQLNVAMSIREFHREVLVP